MVLPKTRGWLALLPGILATFAASQIWLMTSFSHRGIGDIDSAVGHALRRPESLSTRRSTLYVNAHNQTPIIFGLSPGTTGTHTHFKAACRLGLPSIHHMTYCASPHHGGQGIPPRVMDGLKAHANVMRLNDLSYKCTMGEKAKEKSNKYYKWKRAKICNMDVRDWEMQTKGNLTALLGSSLVGLFDYPYPNMADYILETIPKVRGEDFRPTFLYTKRDPAQWTSSRLKHGFLLCKEDYTDIEIKLNSTRESSASAHHGKAPLYLSEFNIFECIERAVARTASTHIKLNDIWYCKCPRLCLSLLHTALTLLLH